MNLSEPFIRRPVGTSLLAIAMTLAGAVAFHLLPVAPLPQVDFPTITVSASLPGASPSVMASTVATPLERVFGRISGLDQMTSSSGLGNTQIVLQFGLKKSINDAAREVQAAINTAVSLLPSGMPSRPTYRKVNPADAPIMILSLTSDSLSRAQMYDAASSIMAQKLATLPGVGQVIVGGAALPAIRVNVDLARLDRMGIGLETVRQAIAGANANAPKGVLQGPHRRWQIEANDTLIHAAQYDPLVIGYQNGAPVRLSAVASVTKGLQDAHNTGRADGKPSVQIIIFREPGANIISTADGIKTALPALVTSIPHAITVHLMSDRTVTIRAALHDTELTLILAVILVIGVVFLFLRDVRATLIPALAVPISLIGTFAAMYLLHFTLDNLSLMALIVAAGFVVDDAVVMTENIMRHLEAGERPLAAALMGAREVGFTVLSMSLSLIAVFIPILLMGGIVGRFFREFAVTLSMAILISLVVSVTLTPMLASRWLVGPDERPPRRAWAVRADALYARLLAGYSRSLEWALARPRFMLLVFFSVIALNVTLYRVVPKSFVPIQDTGMLVASIEGDQSVSFQAMSGKVKRIVALVKSNSAVAHVVAFTGGGGGLNHGFMFITLKAQDHRPGVTAIVSSLRRRLGALAGVRVFMFPVQDIRAGGRPATALYEYTLQSDHFSTLTQWTPRVLAAFRQLRGLNNVNTDQQNHGLETSVEIDRNAAARLGVPISLIDQTLNDAFGQRLVATLYEPLNQYHVVMEASSRYLSRPDALKDIYVVTPSATIALSALVHVTTTNAPLVVNHQGLFAAATISFNLDPGVSLSDAQRRITNTLARMGLPSDVHGSFQGTAALFKDTLKNQPLFILTAILAIYIVLGILYESTMHPVTILSTLPSAGVGAILALLLFHRTFSIIALIGVFLLIGIVKKNAILVVDFALTLERERGVPPEVAVREACLLRLRPILMTTLTALFAAVPLVLNTANGGELREPLGISIAGGLMVSQWLTLYTTPVIYLEIDRLRAVVARWSLSRTGSRGTTG